jgi:hypothetical protein
MRGVGELAANASLSAPFCSILPCHSPPPSLALTPLAPSPPPPAAPYLGVKNGHRLGFWAAVPAALVGLVAGNRTGVFRFLGYTDNGNPTLYPGYKEDHTRALVWARSLARNVVGALPLRTRPALPLTLTSLLSHSHPLKTASLAAYFVKHVVSDRHANVSSSLRLDMPDPTRFR